MSLSGKNRNSRRFRRLILELNPGPAIYRLRRTHTYDFYDGC